MIERTTGRPTLGQPDLAPADERWLGDWARAEHRSEFVFVTGYPMVKRPFYTHPAPDDPAASNSFDLLFRGLELVTGGQRLHRFDDYLRVLDGETSSHWKATSRRSGTECPRTAASPSDSNGGLHGSSGPPTSEKSPLSSRHQPTHALGTPADVRANG